MMMELIKLFNQKLFVTLYEYMYYILGGALGHRKSQKNPSN